MNPDPTPTPSQPGLIVKNCSHCFTNSTKTTSISEDENLCPPCYSKALDKKEQKSWKRREISMDRQILNAINTTIKKETILEEAARLVNGPRRAEYGHPKKNFADIASMWTVILDHTVTPDQVILMMTCLKVCRGKTGYKRDTAADIAGYAQCWELINEHSETP